MVIFTLKMMVVTNEAENIPNLTSMRKLRKQITTWINTYAKTNKQDKVARFIGYYKPLPTLIINAIKSEGVISQTEDGILIDWAILKLLLLKTRKTHDQSYFAPYFRSLK
ncbi:unnamed protein product [Moneuplotes crassus]|uniref:Uncharacterized protein n=1 Tax=Euplotes crassus TaxID=5936 RepID=A0AAD1UL43_EUPCR|nr:unnamed protein product [Moneuplotes crassus]